MINSLASKTNYRRDTLAHSLGIRSVPFILIHSFKDVLDNLDTIEVGVYTEILVYTDVFLVSLITSLIILTCSTLLWCDSLGMV